MRRFTIIKDYIKTTKMECLEYEIVLMVIDIGLFVYLYKLFKEHSNGDELVIPTKKVLPYAILMAVISILIPAIGLCMHLIFTYKTTLT